MSPEPVGYSDAFTAAFALIFCQNDRIVVRGTLIMATSDDAITRLIISVGLCSTLVFWGVYAYDQRLQSKHIALQEVTPTPLLLNGLRPQFVGLEPIDEISAEFAVRPGPLLIMASADSCAISKNVVPLWEDWIRTSAHRSYSVLLVTYDGEQQIKALSESLRARGIEHAARFVRQRRVFARASAITGTPYLVALDADGRVRLTSTDFSDQFRVALDAFITERSYRRGAF